MDKTVSKPKTINTELIYYMFDEIKGELKDIKKEYVTKAESTALRMQIEELRHEFIDYKKRNTAEIEEIKRQKNLWGWLSPTLTAIVTAIFTYLAIQNFKP